MLRNSIKSLLVALAIVVGLVAGSYATGDNIISAGVINFIQGGAKKWAVKIVTNGNLQLYNSATGKVAIAVDDLASGPILATYTTAQLALLAPTSAGTWVFNSTTQHLVRSTGTAAGNWSPYCGQGASCGLDAF